MKKKIQALSLAAALMLTVPIGVYAATTNGTSDSSTTQSADGAFKEGKFAGKARGGHHEGRGGQGAFVSDEVATLLQLDKETIQSKLKEGVTLSALAEEQGVSRDALKAAMTAAFDRQQAERKSAFEEKLDDMIDSEMKRDKPSRSERGSAGDKAPATSGDSSTSTSSAQIS